MHEVGILSLFPISLLAGLILVSCRCPIECRLMRGPEWSCRVFLRRVSTSDGQSVFGQTKEPFGDPVTDKHLLGNLILRAHLAILNPNTHSQSFLDPAFNLSGPSELSFTPNIVCLEITGPDYTDISFVDLPGASRKLRLQEIRLLMVLQA